MEAKAKVKVKVKVKVKNSLPLPLPLPFIGMYKGRELVLASASPRRKELLKSLGIQFRIIPPKVNEEFPPNLPPAEIVENLAFLKANSVAAGLSGAIVIGADTLVSYSGNIIGKPKDRTEAIRILTQLSGTRHSVFTGVCVIDTVTGKKQQGHKETLVQMRRISKEEIEEYVDSGCSMGKAGAYAIQEDNLAQKIGESANPFGGDKFVEEIEGSFSNVVGLPLELLQEMLEKI